MSVIRNGHSHSMLHGLLLVLAVLIFVSGCQSAPTLGSNEASDAADALYTAVTSRRLELVAAVEANLQKLDVDQKISPAAMTALKEIIEQARSGEWQAAAEDLDHLIRNQPAHSDEAAV